MNWLIKLGQWWENRRAIRKPDLEEFKIMLLSMHKGFKERIEEKVDSIKESNQIPQTIVKELALLKIRLDQMELYTGLKRDPKPEHVKGMAKIS